CPRPGAAARVFRTFEQSDSTSDDTTAASPLERALDSPREARFVLPPSRLRAAGVTLVRGTFDGRLLALRDGKVVGCHRDMADKAGRSADVLQLLNPLGIAVQCIDDRRFVSLRDGDSLVPRGSPLHDERFAALIKLIFLDWCFGHCR